MKLNSGKRIKNVYGCKKMCLDPLAHKSVLEARHRSCTAACTAACTARGVHSARRAHRVFAKHAPLSRIQLSSCNTIKSVVLRCVCYNLQISTY